MGDEVNLGTIEKKKCTKCLQIKDIDKFYNTKATRCKSCLLEKSRKYKARYKFKKTKDFGFGIGI